MSKYHGPTDQAIAGVSIHNILSYNGYRPKGGVVQAVVDNMAPKWKGGPTEGHEYIEEVESHPNKVEKFYVTGTKIIKKRGAPLVTEFSQPIPHREPGVYPCMVGSGGGDVPHGAYEFKLAKDLEEAIDYANTAYDIEHTAKYFPEPEFYRYFPREDESLIEYFRNISEEEQQRRIRILREKGYKDEEIKAFLEKQRLEDMEKALADPTNLGNLLRAQLAAGLATGPRAAFPITAPPGGIASPARPSAYHFATSTLPSYRRRPVFTSSSDSDSSHAIRSLLVRTPSGSERVVPSSEDEGASYAVSLLSSGESRAGVPPIGGEQGRGRGRPTGRTVKEDSGSDPERARFEKARELGVRFAASDVREARERHATKTAEEEREIIAEALRQQKLARSKEKRETRKRAH